MNALELAHTPMTWRKNNREVAMQLAAKVQARISNMQMVRVDHKTMVYVKPGSAPMPIIRTQIENQSSITSTRARAVWYNGKTYRTVRDAAEVIGMTYSTLYRKLNGKIKNETNARWASDQITSK
jgi:hypothetical protein